MLELDRYSDISRLIYSTSTKNQQHEPTVVDENPEKNLPPKKVSGNQTTTTTTTNTTSGTETNHQEIESGPLNCKEVKLQSKSTSSKSSSTSSTAKREKEKEKDEDNNIQFQYQQKQRQQEEPEQVLQKQKERERESDKVEEFSSLQSKLLQSQKEKDREKSKLTVIKSNSTRRNDTNDIFLSTAEFDKKEQEMKDLDRLVNDLLQEASTIHDVPYHAREDGLAFRYCTQDDILKNRHKLGGHGHGPAPGSSTTQEWNPLRVENDPHNHFKPSTSTITSAKSNINTSDNKTVSDSFNNKPTISPLSSSASPSWLNSSDTSNIFSSTPINWKSRQTPISTSNNHEEQQQQKQNGRIQIQSPIPSPSINQNQSQNQNQSEDYPKSWSKVTVEYDASPITWTQMPLPDRDRDGVIPTGKSAMQLRQEEINRLRDWSAFQDANAKFHANIGDDNNVNGSSGSTSTSSSNRRQVKYTRSFSSGNFEDPNSDEWLAKQMNKLKLKRSASIRQQHPLMSKSDAPQPAPAWLLELKQRNISAKRESQSQIQSIETPTPKETHIPVEIIRQKSPPPPFDREREREIQIQIQQQQLHQQVLSETPTPRFPAPPPTPYMNKSASRHIETHVQRRGHTTMHNYSTPSRSVPVTTDDDSDEELDEIAKIMYTRKEREDMKFTVDTSTAWYKPSATREETINALTNQPIGTFIIRNSNSFPGAYGLAIKFDEHNIRHFLIEPCKSGVKIRGSAIEPVFSSLSALVYAHTIQPLALPVKLRLTSDDNLIPTTLSQSTTSKLLSQGAACQLLFMGANDVEMLTGEEAIQRSVSRKMNDRTVVVNLRLSKSGLVLTDVMRQNFFRNHYNLSSIIHAGLDPLNRSITVHGKVCKLFGIVVNSGRHNDCLVLAEYENNQPASSIVAFFVRVIQWRSV